MVKLRITTHSGEDDIVEVDVYDAVEINEQRNDPEILGILIGQNSYSRIDIKNITIEEVIEETTDPNAES
jgi:hypothetical protein